MNDKSDTSVILQSIGHAVNLNHLTVGLNVNSQCNCFESLHYSSKLLACEEQYRMLELYSENRVYLLK